MLPIKIIQKPFSYTIFNRNASSGLQLLNKMSSNDGSINYIMKPQSLLNNNDPNSLVECRYVRRSPSYISAYVSSHTGCKMGCTFCWLTQSSQKSFRHTTINDFCEQLNTILVNSPDSFDDRKNIRVNINFMARGEAMANKYIVNNYSELYDELGNTAKKNGYDKIKINISSIYPTSLSGHSLNDIFKNRPVNFYYSIYSINQKFRREFLPSALPVEYALDNLKSLQDKHNDNTVVFHCAFIKGHNDDINDVQKMADLIKSYNFKKTKFNLVRLNPYIKNGKPIMMESDMSTLRNIFNIMNSAVTNKVDTQKSRIINRIGPDVFASCGMFASTDVNMDIFDKVINETDSH